MEVYVVMEIFVDDDPYEGEAREFIGAFSTKTKAREAVSSLGGNKVCDGGTYTYEVLAVKMDEAYEYTEV